MVTVIDKIYRRLQRSGWRARDAKVVTLNGGVLWLVSARRNGQSFSAQGATQREAWQLAWQLAQQLGARAEDRPMIVPFRQRKLALSRAG